MVFNDAVAAAVLTSPDKLIVPGSTSKGPLLATPNALKPPVTSTFLKATSPAEAPSPFASASKEKTKLVAETSAAVATLYKKVPHHRSEPLAPIYLPSINVQPESEALLNEELE